MTRTVLVPYDQSEQADHALDHALRTFDAATVTLLHVVEPFADHTGAAGYEPSRLPDQLDTAREMLDGVREECGADRERIETVVRYGRPPHAILRHVDEESVDHIVMGSHGRDGAARLLLGSVAEATARRSPVPVTVVRHPSDHLGPIDRVLVPFDGSSYARRALTHALERFPDAEVTALYVAYPPTERVGDAGTGFEVLENWDAEREDHARSVLARAGEVADECGRSIDTETATGKPAETIVEYADSEAVDHVVIGSAGRGGISRLLLGSVAETVLRRSPVSVTVAR